MINDTLQRIEAIKQRYVKAKKRQGFLLLTIAALCCAMVFIQNINQLHIDLSVPNMIDFDSNFYELDDFVKENKQNGES